MKKLFLLTLIAGLAITANAQWHNDSRPGTEYSRNDDFNKRAMFNRISSINDQYNDRISSVKHNPFLSNREKRRQIRGLERERRSAIEQSRNGYSRSYDDGYGRNNDHSGRW